MKLKLIKSRAEFGKNEEDAKDKPNDKGSDILMDEDKLIRNKRLPP